MLLGTNVVYTPMVNLQVSPACEGSDEGARWPRTPYGDKSRQCRWQRRGQGERSRATFEMRRNATSPTNASPPAKPVISHGD